MNLSPDKKIAGVLVPLFALRRDNDLGIGDVAALREMIDWVSEYGFKLIQLLPINEIGGDNSPYNAISAMAIEPTTLHLGPGSPEDLSADDFESVTANTDLAELRRGGVKYPQVKKLNRQLLEKAFAQFCEQGNPERVASFREFCEREFGWLDEYAFFRALMEENGGRENWDEWPYQTLEVARTWFAELPGDHQAAFVQRQTFFCYVQWIAHRQ